MQSSKKQKVLLIGWDAADWNIINPLLDAGQMPNLERFIDQGVIGNLATLQPVLSPMLWTSIATGKRPYKHGICGFAEPDPGNGGIRPVTNLSRKTKAIWNILQQSGSRSNVVGWWPSHPVEPISGVMVSNHYQQATTKPHEPWTLRPGTVHPARLEEHLKPLRIHPLELEAEHLLPFVPRAAEIDQATDSRLLAVAKTIADCSSIHAAATAIMQLEPWDFMAVYYDAIDHFCHGFMKYHPPRQDWIDEHDFQLFKDVVNSAYRYHDMLLGTLLALAGEETTVILMSDHGFHSNHLRPAHLPNEPAGPAAEHRNFGIFAIKGPDIRQDERIYGASLLDITPTILHLFGLPVGKDMDGKVLSQCFRQTGPMEAIDSWDDIDGDTGQHPPGMQIDPIESHEGIGQLVAMGYIDEPDEDSATAVKNSVRELEYNLARAWVDGGGYTQAIGIFESLWERWPEEQRFGVKLLNCYLSTKNVERARETFDLIVKRKRTYAIIAQRELGELEQELGDAAPDKLSKSQRRCRKQLRAKSTTNHAAVAFLGASVSLLEGDHHRALQMLSRASQGQQADLPAVLLKRGEIFLELRDWLSARECFDSIVALDPSNPHGFLGLSRVHLELRNGKLAAKHAAASIGLVYHNPSAHFLHGICLMRLNQMDSAFKAMETAVSQYPGFVAAHRRLARWYRRFRNDHSCAEFHSEQVRILETGNGSSTQSGPIVSGSAELDAIGCLLPTVQRDQENWNRNEVITVVSGLPRSGTSMMMQMLEAGGVKIVTDNVRTADENNLRGYLEFEPVKSMIHQRPNWLGETRGRAVKIVAPLLPFMNPEYRYRVIVMQRDLDEVVASQEKMLSRIGRRGANLGRASLKKHLQRQLHEAVAAVSQFPHVEVLPVDYHQTLQNPALVAKQVAGFLDQDQLDFRAMADTVDQNLHREKKEDESTMPAGPVSGGRLPSSLVAP